MGSPNKKKITRKHKKWLSEEIKCILNYMEQEKNVEEPTAQIYYKKLISKTGINATWDLIRWKMRHLKDSYKKANDWCHSNNASLLDEDWKSDSIKAEILRICPQYYQLDRIFGQNNGTQTQFEIVDIKGEISEPYSTPQTDSVSSFQHNDDDECSDSQNYNSIDSTNKIFDNDMPNTLTVECSTGEFLEKTYKRKSTSSYLAELQSQRASFYKKKFKLDIQKDEEEIILSNKRLDLEEMKIKADIEFQKKLLELKAREIVRDEKLKILEMEKDERLKRYEIEMKYKCESENATTT